MPKSFQQKLKILYLMRVFAEKTDEAHPMSVKDLIAYLENFGIHAERKTIYDDIETLRVFGMDIMNRRERPSGFYLASREFEVAELKLLVDAVQSSRFLTTGKSRQLIQKLESLTSIYQAKDLQRQVIVQNRVKNTNENIYYNIDEIHRAISQNRQISFQYTEWTVSKERQLKKGGARYQISPWHTCSCHLHFWKILHSGPCKPAEQHPQASGRFQLPFRSQTAADSRSHSI